MMKQVLEIFFDTQMITEIMNKRLYSYLRRAVQVGLMLIIPVQFTWTQDTITIGGRVLNGNNQPVANAAVGIEGSTELPAVTSETGDFEIKTISGNRWLNISPPSEYKSKRIFVRNQTDLTIYLTSSNIESGEDEITLFSRGFTRKNLTSSFSTVNVNNTLYSQDLSIDKFLQGRLSGMHVASRSGFPGSGAATQIRGGNSLLGDNRPLYVIDGIPLTGLGEFSSNIQGFEPNALMGINPLDISQITVVKDATLTALYGSKAANGVVFIETLSPSVTETIIEVDFRVGYALAPENQLPQMSAGQHKTLVSELLFSSGMQEEQVQEEYPLLFLAPDDDRYIDYQHNTNWQDIVFSDASTNNIHLNVKGGDEIARYGLSFGYASADGIIRRTGYDGYNLRFVGLLNIFSWLKMNAGVSMKYSNANIKESAKSRQTSPILTSLLKSPMLNPYKYDSKGEELAILAEVDELGVSNPLAVIENQEAKNTGFNFTSTLGFIAEINENLQFQTDFGLAYDIMKEENFRPNLGMELYDEGEAINVSQATSNTLSSFYSNSYLSFSKKISASHSLTSITGFQILSNQYQLDWALTRNSSENDQYRMLQDGTSGLWDIGGTNRVWNWASIYQNLNYSFQDKYLASASISLDGSSRVGADAINTIKIGEYPIGLFYGVGAGWRISSEPFLNGISILEELKLRASYGRVGNDDIGESTANNYYKIVKLRSTTGLYPALIPNKSLGYEITTKLNGGLDIALMGNRFFASFDYYNSISDQLLIYAPMESYLGFNFRPENGGKMENSGFEIHSFLRIIDGSKFKLDLEAWYTNNTNKIVKISGDGLVNNVLGGEVINKIGEKANSFYGYLYNGVYASTEEAKNNGLVNERGIPYEGGDAIYKDLSGPDGEPDGVINYHDKTVIGSSMPDQFGGLRNTYTFQRWSLSVFLNVVEGNQLFNYVRFMNEHMSGLENQSTKALARWQYNGQATDVPRAILNDPVGNSDFSTRWIEDGTYIRLKNVTLSYTVPEKFLSFRNAQIYISAVNVYTLSDYLGFDPEFAHSHEAVSQGIDYGLAPQPRQFVAGIKLGL